MKKEDLIEALSESGIPALDKLTVDQLNGIKTLADERDEFKALVEELNGQINNAPNSEKPAEYTVDGDTYTLIVPRSNYHGKIITRETLAAQPALVKELVEIGSGVLKKKGGK